MREKIIKLAEKLEQTAKSLRADYLVSLAESIGNDSWAREMERLAGELREIAGPEGEAA